MKWLVHGKTTPAVAEALKRHEHSVQLAGDIGLTDESTPAEILNAARRSQLEIMTADDVLAHAPYAQGARFGRVIVYLLVDPQDIEQDDAVDRLFKRYKRLNMGRLYTVTNSRVKIRQLPASPVQERS